MIVPGWMMVVVTLDNCYLPLGKSCGLLLNPDLHEWKISLDNFCLRIADCYLTFAVGLLFKSRFTQM